MPRNYWISFDHDLHVTINGCPVVIRRPGGTVLQIADTATPKQAFDFIAAYPGAICLPDDETSETTFYTDAPSGRGGST